MLFPFRLLLLCLTLLPLRLNADDRRGKTPPSEFYFDEFSSGPDSLMARTGGTAYRKIEFHSGLSPVLDTERLYQLRFDRRGRLVESTDYEYDKPLREERPLPYNRIRTQIRTGRKTVYERDTAGNVTAMKKYEVLAAGSTGALAAALKERFPARSAGDGQQTMEEYTRQQAKELRFADSFLSAARQEAEKLKQEIRYTYDEAGNVTTKISPTSKQQTVYDYRYFPGGQVRVKRGIDRTADRPQNVNGHETHYTYDASGRPQSIAAYFAPRDTGEIALPKYLDFRQEIHYTPAGDPDTLRQEKRGIGTMQVSSYDRDRRRTALIFLQESEGGRLDTASVTTYTYVKGRESGSRTVRYARGRPGVRKSTVTAYNNRGLPVESSSYVEAMSPGRPYDEVRQHLYFYGNPAEDRQTAERRKAVQQTLQTR